MSNGTKSEVVKNGFPARALARWIIKNVPDEETTVAISPDKDSPLVFDVRIVKWDGPGHHVMLEDSLQHMSSDHGNWLMRLNEVSKS